MVESALLVTLLTGAMVVLFFFRGLFERSAITRGILLAFDDGNTSYVKDETTFKLHVR